MKWSCAGSCQASVSAPRPRMSRPSRLGEAGWRRPAGVWVISGIRIDASISCHRPSSVRNASCTSLATQRCEPTMPPTTIRRGSPPEVDLAVSIAQEIKRVGCAQHGVRRAGVDQKTAVPLPRDECDKEVHERRAYSIRRAGLCSRPRQIDPDRNVDSRGSHPGMRTSSDGSPSCQMNEPRMWSGHSRLRTSS